MWSPKASGQIVNVGSDQETSVFALAQTIRELAASAAEIVCLDARDEEIEKRRPSLAKARRLLDWEPRVNLREGLSRTIDWYRAVLAGLDQEVAEELLQAGVR
jgi:UDP-glucuronate decarboxylase